MINRKIFLAIGLLLLFPLDLPAQVVDLAEDWLYFPLVDGQRALEGLGAVNVVIEYLDDETQRLVSRDQIQTDVELNLRRNGIGVGGSVFDPYVYVNIDAMEDRTTSGRSLGFSVITRVEIREIVLLRRDEPKRRTATIWRSAFISTFANRSSATQGTRQEVRDLVDEFSNDYLAANPR